MARYGNMLERVRVAAPCQAEWDEMRGDERVRFCHRCELNVYNLSALTRREAERLVMNTEGRLCVRFYRRADGTILTRNCPVGLRALKRRVSRVASATFAALTSLLAGVGIVVAVKDSNSVIQPAAVVAEEEAVCMGICSTMIDPFAEQCAAATLLASGVFLLGYPLLKLRERREARRSEALHIWRRS